MLSGRLARWIMQHTVGFDATAGSADQVMLERMQDVQWAHAKTRKEWRPQHRAHVVPRDEETVGVLWYNPLLVRFGAQHPPSALTDVAHAVEALQWPVEVDRGQGDGRKVSNWAWTPPRVRVVALSTQCIGVWTGGI